MNCQVLSHNKYFNSKLTTFVSGSQDSNKPSYEWLHVQSTKTNKSPKLPAHVSSYAWNLSIFHTSHSRDWNQLVTRYCYVLDGEKNVSYPSKLAKHRHQYAIPKLAFASQRSENDICIFCRTKKVSFFDLLWLCGEMSCVWQGFMKWLAKHQIKLKSNIFISNIL